jgi:hypothetical protein
VTGAGELDLDGAPIGCTAPSLDESGLLHAVEVTGQCGPLDADGREPPAASAGPSSSNGALSSQCDSPVTRPPKLMSVS